MIESLLCKKKMRNILKYLSLSTQQFHQTSYFRKVVVYPSNVIAEMRHGITFAGDLAFYKKAAAAVPSSHDDEAIERASCKG